MIYKSHVIRATIEVLDFFIPSTVSPAMTRLTFDKTKLVII